MTRLSLALLLTAALTHAAIEGTVMNGSTGKPQPNATVTLYKVGGNGPSPSRALNPAQMANSSSLPMLKVLA